MKRILVSILCVALIFPFVGCESNHENKDPELHWVFGGVDGSHAEVDSRMEIGNLNVSKSSMSYSWIYGSLESWGLAHNQATAYACMFFKDTDGRWYGGKFDWISTSRTTRSFENIRGRYHGWDPIAFEKSSKKGFCILSRDLSKRTNLIIQ